MSFTSQDGLYTIQARLTSYGRRQISRGLIDFSYYSIGDSEYDYSLGDGAILKPEDNPAGIKHYILDSQEDIDFLKPLQKVKESKFPVINTAKTRGFFYTESNNTYLYDSQFYTKKDGVIDLCNAGIPITSGYTNTLNLSDAINIEQGDLLMLAYNTDLTISGETASTGTTLVESRPYLFYKIQGITGNTIELDRQIPVGRLCDSYYHIYPKDFLFYDKSPIKYWDKASQNLNDTCPDPEDVLVWNLNIAWPKDIIGTDATNESYTGYGSRKYLSYINYLSLDPNKAIGIVHYTNNTIGNFYSEAFENGTAILELPTIFHYKKASISMELICYGDMKEINDNNFSLKYYDLAFEYNSEYFIVGKCLPNQKIFIIEDQELLSALTYKSDRNAMYPDFNATLIYNEGLIPILESSEEKELLVTYYFESSAYLSPLPCQYFKRLSFSVGGNNCLPNTKAALQFSIDPTNLMFLGQLPSKPYEFEKLHVLVQKVDIGAQPERDMWKKVLIVDKTGTFIAPSDCGNISIIEGDDYTGAGIYDINDYIDIPSLLEQDKLQFGDEFFFFGNVKTDIRADVFQSSFYVSLDFDRALYSENPSWNDSYSEVRVTECGIYDSSFKPVAWAKFPLPIVKPFGQNRVIVVSIDF